VRLTVDGAARSQPLELRKDPRLPELTQADLEEQFRLAAQVRDRTSQANQAVIEIRRLKQRLLQREPQPGASGREILARLSSIEEAIYQVKNRSPRDTLNFPIRLNNRLAALQRVIEEADGRPTRQSYDVLQELGAELDRQLARLAALKLPD
jgi:hypothetical protein